MKTFKDLEFKGDITKRARLNFPNGYGISVVYGSYTYSDNGTYEVGILKDDCLYYETPLTNNVLGYQTPEQINKIIEELLEYKKDQY